MGMQVGEHAGITTRAIYRERIAGTSRYRDTILTKHDGRHYAHDDTEYAHPLAVTRYRSRTRTRDRDGVIRVVQAEGVSRAEAERAIRRKLTARTTQGSSGVSGRTTMSDLWTTHRAYMTTEGRGYAARSLDTYDRLAARILADMGGLTVGEVTTARAQDCVDSIAATNGPTTARMARALLSAMMGTAARHDALTVNPVRETKAPRIERTLTTAPDTDTVKAVLDALDYSDAPMPRRTGAKRETGETVAQWAHRAGADVADVVTFAAGTGMRPTEIFGLRWDDVDLADGTVSVAGNAIWTKADGMTWQPRAKSEAGRRTIAPAERVLAMLTDRRVAGMRPSVYVFPSRTGGLRDANAFRRQWRRVREAVGAEGLDLYDFRRYVNTELIRAGVPDNERADYMGHANVWQGDDYTARGVVHRVTGQVLTSLIGDGRSAAIAAMSGE